MHEVPLILLLKIRVNDYARHGLRGGNQMKVIIGSIIVIILLGIGIWLMMSPSFQQIGDTVYKLKKKLKEDEDDGERDNNEKR